MQKKKKPTIKRVKKKLTAVKKAVLGKVKKQYIRKSSISNRLKKVKKLGNTLLEHARQAITNTFSDGEAKGSPAPQDNALPWRYPETRAVLLVRDPWWVFAYWDVQDEHETRVRADVLRANEQVERKVLRVYDVGEKSFFDIEPGTALNWYVDLGRPDRECYFEVGLRTVSGRFFVLVRSNTVKTPPYGFSNVIDEEWMLPDEDYWKLFGVWADFSGGKSSYDINEFIKKFVQSVSSRGSNQLSPNNKAVTKTHTETTVKKTHERKSR